MKIRDYLHAYGTSEGVRKEWDERRRDKQITDPKTGRKTGIHGPFDSKEDAVEYAKKLGLGKRSVKSRPSGYVVEEY